MKGKAARAATHPSVLGLPCSVTNVGSNPKGWPRRLFMSTRSLPRDLGKTHPPRGSLRPLELVMNLAQNKEQASEPRPKTSWTPRSWPGTESRRERKH